VELPLNGQPMQNVTLPLKLPERGKAKMEIALLRAGTKTPLFTENRDVVIPHVLTVSPPIPTHWAVEDGPPNVSGDIDLEVPAWQLKDATLGVRLVDSAGKSMATWAAPAATGWKTFNLKCTQALPEGSYKLVGELAPKSGKPTIVERPCGVIPRRLSKVTINAAGYPVSDGK